MSYYNSDIKSRNNTYYYPRMRTQNLKINHIVDFTPEECKSTYQFRMRDGRPSDTFYFKPTHSNSKEKKIFNYESYQTKYGNEAIREIHNTVYEPHKFNENGILREKDNYILYENKNWTENVAYPVVEYEKIELPLPPPPPKPKPKPKKILEKSVEVFREEIEREEDRKKNYLKSKFIRINDAIKNKKFKYKGKKYNGNKKNYYTKKGDNIISIYDCKNEDNKVNKNFEGDNEITKIKKLTEKKQINDKNYTDTIMSKKEYKLHKTSTITVPVKK